MCCKRRPFQHYLVGVEYFFCNAKIQLFSHSTSFLAGKLPNIWQVKIYSFSCLHGVALWYCLVLSTEEVDGKP